MIRWNGMTQRTDIFYVEIGKRDEFEHKWAKYCRESGSPIDVSSKTKTAVASGSGEAAALTTPLLPDGEVPQTAQGAKTGNGKGQPAAPATEPVEAAAADASDEKAGEKNKAEEPQEPEKAPPTGKGAKGAKGGKGAKGKQGAKGAKGAKGGAGPEEGEGDRGDDPTGDEAKADKQDIAKALKMQKQYHQAVGTALNLMSLIDKNQKWSWAKVMKTVGQCIKVCKTFRRKFHQRLSTRISLR